MSIVAKQSPISATAEHFLLRPWERWRSIVMSTSLCVSVCLSLQDICGTTHAIFTNFSVHVAYGRGLVVVWQGDEIPRGREVLGGFLTFLLH